MRHKRHARCSGALSAFLIACLSLSNATVQPQDAKLFSQTVNSVLESRFGQDDLSWLLIDGSGQVLAERWSNAETPVSPGSLLKPFVAEAYGEQHDFVFPHALCTGIEGRCWLAHGHGRLGLSEAITQSCNAYFISLAAGIDREKAIATLMRYGLAGPANNASDAAMIGLGDQWRETPLALARAYLELVNESTHSGAIALLHGMSAAAQTGTARGVDQALGNRAALAKTGTAPCTHRPRGAADGFAVVLYPASEPRMLLLVRLHGATGAQAAISAGAMLRAIGMGNLDASAAASRKGAR